MKYLLDTCILSDFAKGDAYTINNFQENSPEALAISVITVMEIEYGLQLISGKKSMHIKEIMTDLFKVINLIPLCR
jgi:tRNA(fMet)-specific endonuclease VapC